MTASKSLPARPSLESLRKQAKKRARERSITLRDAQFVTAREYGYAGWPDLTAEVSKRAIQEHAGHVTNIRHVAGGDLTRFVRGLQREPWLLGDAFVWFQAELIGTATLNNREEFIVALLDLNPAILRSQPPPPLGTTSRCGSSSTAAST